MLKIENYEVLGWEHAIRGMRNPKNSWDRSDSLFFDDSQGHLCHIGQGKVEGDGISMIVVGDNDHKLMMTLASGGPVHAKYRRMITVYLDITAPLYWWKEFDTYKVSTVANSCSTMHKIHAKEFTLDDFSCEHLMALDDQTVPYASNIKSIYDFKSVMEGTIEALNNAREWYLETKDKKYWWQMIQLLPTSYNQKRTVMLNYEVLHNIYESRRHHKLDEWHTLCDWIEKLPYAEIIIGEKKDGKAE